MKNKRNKQPKKIINNELNNTLRQILLEQEDSIRDFYIKLRRCKIKW